MALDAEQYPAFDADPVEVLWAPGRDNGLVLLADPGQLWTPVKGGTIRALGLSENPEINQRFFDERIRIAEQAMFSSVIEFATVPARVSNLLIYKNSLAVDGKWVLSGPAGDRMSSRCQTAWRRAQKRPYWGKRLTQYFEDNAQRPLPIAAQSADDVPFVIEAKNLTNYYHFTKEVLAALTTLDAIPGHHAPIIITYHKRPPAPFVTAFIEALFPEHAERVRFEKAPRRYDDALICWYGDYAGLREDGGQHYGTRHTLDGSHIGAGLSVLLRHAGYSRALRLLRERALRVIKQGDFDHFPAKFWITRKGGHDRVPKAEGALIAAFAERGFETLAFEDLSPLEQVAAMNRAETVASYHGAGFTNMMYAGRKTQVFELGTLQTGAQRVGDFSAFCHVSECSYTHAVADFEYDGDREIPPMRGYGLYPVRISEAGIARLMDRVDASLR